MLVHVLKVKSPTNLHKNLTYNTKYLRLFFLYHSHYRPDRISNQKYRRCNQEDQQPIIDRQRRNIEKRTGKSHYQNLTENDDKGYPYEACAE